LPCWTKRLIEQVKRNVERFPADFMFQLDETETAAVATPPYVFTE